MQDAFDQSFRAAAEVEDTSGSWDTRRWAVERKAAAEASLRRSFEQMGLDMPGLSLPYPELEQDLTTLALPLSVAPVGGATADTSSGEGFKMGQWQWGRS
jgi:hypothetical protein